MLRTYLTEAEQGQVARMAPLVHDLVAGHGAIDDLLDQVMHHTGIAPDELSLRRLSSYVSNLPDLLRTDADVYGWPRE